MADERLIVALDLHTFDDVKNLVDDLGDTVNFYKVGMELFYSVGAPVVEWLKSQDKKIFLDLKLHDIPNTVAGGLCSLMNLGANILNVHAAGGFTMMKTAAQALREQSERCGLERPKLIAITVLTSINQSEWCGALKISEQVVEFAKLAQAAGLDGVVASPQEAKLIRSACGEKFLIVTPGIRPAGANLNDQQRISTPAAALQNGATHLVIGRPIRAVKKPREAAEKILSEMQTCRKRDV